MTDVFKHSTPALYDRSRMTPRVFSGPSWSPNHTDPLEPIDVASRVSLETALDRR